MPESAVVAVERQARRVLIIDGHPIVRQGLRQIIEGACDLMVCAEADSAMAARAAIGECHPHAIVTDISLQQGDGIELVRQMRADHPQLRLLVLSDHDESIYAERLLSAGANGYIMKEADSEQILMALRRVLDGGTYVSGAVGARRAERLGASRKPESGSPIDRLSTRELQILHMLGKGMTTRETAHSLNLSIKTVESHRQRLKRKLNLGTATRLIQYAINVFSARDAGSGDCAVR